MRICVRFNDGDIKKFILLLKLFPYFLFLENQNRLRKISLSVTFWLSLNEINSLLSLKTKKTSQKYAGNNITLNHLHFITSKNNMKPNKIY